MTASSSASNLARRPSDRWIPWYFVLFFLVIASVDATMVTLAITTQTGVITRNPYQKGLKFNELLADAARQQAIGLTATANFADEKLTWALKEADGTPLTGATVTARLVRPVQDGHDFTIPLTASKTPGIYSATPRFPLPGNWTANLEATWQTSAKQPQRYTAQISLNTR